MTFQSEHEALEALDEARPRLISGGYTVAVELAEKHGAVHAQMVWAEMDKRGLLSESDKGHNASWLGNIFVGKGRKDSWEKVSIVKTKNATRNSHNKNSTLWKIAGAPDPEGHARQPDCPVCGRSDDPRPANGVLTRFLDQLRGAVNAGMLKQTDEVKKVGRWLAKLKEM